MFSSKKVVINAYTHRADVYKFSAPYKAAQQKPSWWKAIKNKDLDVNDPFGHRSMKGCAGFNNLYASSIVLPMWSDLIIRVGQHGTGEWAYQYADKISTAISEDNDGRGGWLDDSEYLHMKLDSPWLFASESDTQFLFTNCKWESEDPEQFTVLNGVVDYKTQCATNVNMIIKRADEQQSILIEQGSPLAMMIPMTDKKVELRTHLVSKDEYDKVWMGQSPHLWFKNKYYKSRKCPFAK